ncbi:MAG TPA: hypothetical protein VJ697_16715 [Nitrososphaeraceae archaeon]|nr:hypothetical protein [Nitrososphaeraceae archaeon]
MVNNENNIETLEWSAWLDFNKDTIETIPEEEGVYKMHASMKILYIGNSSNLRRSILESLSMPCLSKATRFSYAATTTQQSQKTKEDLLNEYRNKHNGKSPICMES